MVSGLIQIASYGTQDIFLTGNPEITFFRVVYRRHTNFSLETLRVDFDNEVNFGHTSSARLPNYADLIHRIYLHVELPEIDFKKGVDAGIHDEVTIDDDEETINRLTGESGELTVAWNNLYTIDDFIRINVQAYRKAKAVYDSENDDDVTNQMLNEITEIFEPVDEEGDPDIDARNRIDTIISETSSLLNGTQYADMTHLNLQIISAQYDGDSDKDVVMNNLLSAVSLCHQVYDYFYAIVLEKRQELEEAQSENIKFAWVEKVGHVIAERMEIEIGGHTIDRQYGDWLNVWSQLSQPVEKEENYRKMIGDVKLLTEFNRNVKPKYTLMIPLQFWFCRFNGLALPIIALEYHEVNLHLKFRKLQECAYVEKDRLISMPGIGDDLFLDEIGEDELVDLEAYLMVEYVFLDSDERKRFARSSHEYLIEQLTTHTFEGISALEFKEAIDGVHPCPEMIWTVQKDSYRTNEHGFTKCRWDNYSLVDENEGNPIMSSMLEFHGYERVPLLDGNYFNYVLPYQYHQRTPSDGINIFPFALHPEEYQPSGSANLSRLSGVMLNIVIDPLMYVDNETVTVTVYLRTYNILRFVSGMAGCAYATR